MYQNGPYSLYVKEVYSLVGALSSYASLDKVIVQDIICIHRMLYVFVLKIQLLRHTYVVLLSILVN